MSIYNKPEYLDDFSITKALVLIIKLNIIEIWGSIYIDPYIFRKTVQLYNYLIEKEKALIIGKKSYKNMKFTQTRLKFANIAWYVNNATITSD